MVSTRIILDGNLMVGYTAEVGDFSLFELLLMNVLLLTNFKIMFRPAYRERLRLFSREAALYKSLITVTVTLTTKWLCRCRVTVVVLCRELGKLCSPYPFVF